MEKAASAPIPISAAAPAKPTTNMREILDELVLVFVLVMFLKMFIVEHYKIPSGSMTPTLLGGKVAYFKTDNEPGLAYWRNGEHPELETPLVYSKRDGRWELDPSRAVDTAKLLGDGAINTEFDHVLVNRLAYWFHNPRRGDIVVFKVPASIFSIEAPIYIKRLAGEPNDTLIFTPDGRLIANGNLVDKPAFYQTQHYLTTITDSAKDAQGYPQSADMRIQYMEGGAWKIDQIRVPPDKAYVFGDNSTQGGSWDSRYWGGVALQNFKGKAFLRVWPISTIKFLK